MPLANFHIIIFAVCVCVSECTLCAIWLREASAKNPKHRKTTGQKIDWTYYDKWQHYKRARKRPGIYISVSKSDFLFKTAIQQNENKFTTDLCGNSQKFWNKSKTFQRQIRKKDCRRINFIHFNALITVTATTNERKKIRQAESQSNHKHHTKQTL